MSDCRPSRSSSASRKTWLSSTRRSRIGPGTARRVFGCEQERVVRLAAGLDVELETGMLLLEPLQERGEVRIALAGQERQDAAGLGEEAFRDGVRNLVEIGAAGDRLPRRETEVIP